MIHETELIETFSAFSNFARLCRICHGHVVFWHLLFVSDLFLQNRFYVETKLKTDLNEELLKLFRTNVVDTQITFLLCKYKLIHDFFLKLKLPVLVGPLSAVQPLSDMKLSLFTGLH